MPAQSKAQQQAAGMALAAKRGEMNPDDLQGAAKEMYDSMTQDELEDYADTEHEGLPDKKESRVTEGKARDIWNNLKNTVGALLGLSSVKAIDMLSNLSPTQISKITKGLRLISQALNDTGILSSVQKNKRVKGMIESDSDPDDIVKKISAK